MKILEAWSAGITILLSGLLPQPEIAVASLTVASDLYSVLSMAFLAGGMAACARCLHCSPLSMHARAVATHWTCCQNDIMTCLPGGLWT